MQVIKRDDSIQKFSFEKVKDAVKKAFDSVKQELPDKFLEQLKEKFESIRKDKIDVEDIQDIIQKALINKNKYDVVESFINYRRKHAEARENKSSLIKQIRAKMNATNIENQNANVDEASFGGRVGEAADVVLKHEALKMMSKMARKNHEENMIYVHDLNSFLDGRHNCLTIPIDKPLAIGFHTRQTDVRPAGSINTAMQLCAVIMQCQSLEQFGGVAYSHIDWSMVPYIRKSFAKHFIDGLVYVQKCCSKDIAKKTVKDRLPEVKELPNDDRINYLNEMLEMTLSIEDEFYKSYSDAYQYALDMVEKETRQAVEGLFHNLNTLN